MLLLEDLEDLLENDLKSFACLENYSSRVRMCEKVHQGARSIKIDDREKCL